MGDTIWVEVRGRPLEETGADLSFLLRAIFPLDELAAGLGVPAPSGFLDYTEVERDMQDIIDPPEGRGRGRGGHRRPEESVAEREAVGKWFDAAAGLATVRALHRHLEVHPDAVRFKEAAERDERRCREELMNDLRRCERMLAEAVAEGRRFRLLIVP
jgi:hypothetical protein